MGMKKCPDCELLVSTRVYRCPHCGREPYRTHPLAWLILGVFVLWLFWAHNHSHL
jgi:hypothetical protein